MKECPICEGSMNVAFESKVLSKYDVTYFRCNDCGLLQTEEPFWLEEAYSDAIAVTDTGLVMRNNSLSAKLAVILYLFLDEHASYVDVAGGYGLLTRLMRDYGYDYYWEDKFCQNLLSKGFESDKVRGYVAAMTAFEVIEHIHDPVRFINENIQKHGCNTFIFTTELYGDDCCPDRDWWYYAFDTGQHISFYQTKTLERVASKLNLNYYAVNDFHIITDKALNMSSLYSILLKKPLASMLASLIRKRLGSKVISDHVNLVKDLRF